MPPGGELGGEDLYDLYDRPAGRHVRAGLVASIDGAVAVAGRSGGLSSPADKAVFLVLRAASDVVLVGAGTARTEGYGPIQLPEDLRSARARQGRGPRPALAVVSASGRLDGAGRLFEDPDQPVLVLLPEERVGTSQFPAHVEQVAVGHPDVDPGRVVAELVGRGLQHVLCEGGPRLLGTLLAADLIDELCLTVSPQLIGGEPRLLPVGLPSPRPARLTSLVDGGGVLLSRWSLR